MRVIISKRPRCKYCGELMEEWNPYLKEKDQAHPECAGRAMAIETLASLTNSVAELDLIINKEEEK